MNDIEKHERSLFLHCLDLDPQQISEYLAEACRQNPEVQCRVEALLAANTRGSDLFDQADQQTALLETPDDQIAKHIGPYKLLQVIGEGGMGTVYMAKQTEPVNRKVALKLIKTGMDTRQVIARFEAERQALAMMDHPNIAKVLDAGATESGRPYFVMEMVKGIPITQFCDEQQLDLESRLKLFQDVCHGVQHAHQKGIIHRDLKPSNVLVAMYDDQPVPKVIDFGVAKASGDELTEKTMFTRLGQIVGTLEYMSPEQAQLNNLDIDTRSDIYSLGAILYELLSGEPPFGRERLKSQALDETLRMIREEEPTKPSTRLSSAKKTTQSATDRRTSPAKLGGILEGDLDWIVLKALAKDRLQRYETANGFAADIQRFLTDEPVTAGPPSTVYHIRKFVRRNRAAILTVSLVAGLLIAGTVISAWQAIRATRAEQQAQVEKQNAINEAAISKAVNDFLNEDLLGSASPHGEPDRDLKVRELLDRVATTVETRFIDQPLVEAKIRVTLANAYKSLGEYKNADVNLQRARTLTEQELGTEHRDFLEMSLEILWVDHIWSEEYERICTQLEGVVQQCSGKFGNDDPLTLRARSYLADMHRHLDQYETAEAQLFEIVESCQRILGNSDQLTLDVQLRLADLYFDMRRYVDSEKISHQVLLERQESIGIEHPATLGSLSVLAKSIAAQGRFKEAAELYGRLIEFQTRVLGADHPVLLQNRTELGLALINHGQSQRAETILREVLNTYGTSVSSRHPYRLRAMNLLSYALLNQDKIEESLELENEIVEVKTATFGAEHPNTLNILQNIATNLLALGRFQESENRFRKVLEVRRRVQSPEHRYAITAMEGIGLCLMGLGRYDEAESRLREAYTINQKEFGLADFQTINSAGQLAEILLKKENYADAEQVVSQAIAAGPETVDSENRILLYCERVLATAECLQGKNNQSEARARQVLETLKRTSGDRNRETLHAGHVLAMVIDGMGRHVEAEAQFQNVLESRCQVLGAEHPDTLETMHRLASVIAKQGRYDDAVKLRRDVVELRLTVFGEQHPDTVNSRLALAGDLLNLDSPQESEVLCREILKSNKNVLGQQKHAIIQCHKTLADALRQQGRTEEAAKVQEELALLQND